MKPFAPPTVPSGLHIFGLVLAGCLLGSPPCQAQTEALPPHAYKRFGTTHLRHGSQIQSLAFSADNKVLAAGGGNDFVRLWNTDSGTEQRHFKQFWVSALAFSPRDGMLAMAGAFKKIRLFDPSTGAERAVLEGHQAPIKAMVFSADGAMLASGCEDGSVILWKPNVMTRPFDTLSGHIDEVTALAFSPKGTRLASAGTDRTIRQWNLDGTDMLPKIEAGCGVTGLVYSSDGKILISAGDDNLIRLWDPANGKQLDLLKGHEGTIVSLLLSRDGQTLVSSGRDRTIRFWDLAGKKAGRVHARGDHDGDALALSGDGKLLAYAGRCNTIHIVEAGTGKRLFPDLGSAAPILGLGLSKDGKTLISSSGDRMLQTWEAGSAKFLARLAAGPTGDLTVPFALAGNVQDGKIKRGETIASKDPILALAGSPDGMSFALGHRSGKVSLHLVGPDKTVLVETLQYPGLPFVLAFSQDGKTLAVSGNSKVVIVDVAQGKEIQQFQTKLGPVPTQPRVASLAFSPSGKSLAVGCYDGITRLFDLATGKQTTVFDGHLSAVLSLAFSPDGGTLVTGSFDHTVNLWETFNGGLIASYKGHIGAVNAVCFAADGRSFFSGSDDTTILQWDATRTSKDGVLPTVVLNNVELEDAWIKLATLDSARGQEIAWKLATGAKESVPYLGGRLFYVDGKQIDQLFTELDHDSFAVRSKATEELAGYCVKYGMWMRGRLEEAVRNPPSEEVRFRAEQLLNKLIEMPSALSLQQERMRVHRSMQILEQSASPAALEVLRKLARGAPERHLQAEAQLALDRLKKTAKTEK